MVEIALGLGALGCAVTALLLHAKNNTGGKTPPGPQGPTETYNPGKLKFLTDVQDFWKSVKPWGTGTGYQPLGNISYVRTASMYADPWGTRAVMKVHSGPFAEQVLHEGFNNDVVERGTFAALANYIKWELTTARGINGNSYYGINGDTATEIIENYVTALGQENTLGRGGPTCSYACSIMNSLGDWGKIISVITSAVALIGGFVASPFTGGASLLAALPAAKKLYDSIK